MPIRSAVALAAAIMSVCLAACGGISTGAGAAGLGSTDPRAATGLHLADLVRKVVVPVAEGVSVTAGPNELNGTFELPSIDGDKVHFIIHNGKCPPTSDATLQFSGMGFQIGKSEYRLPVDADGTDICLALASVNPAAMESYIVDFRRGFGDRFGINWVLSELEGQRGLGSIKLTRRKVSMPPADIEIPYFETLVNAYGPGDATKPVIIIGSYESTEGPLGQSAQMTRSTKGFMREFGRIAGDEDLRATKVTGGVVTIRRDF